MKKLGKLQINPERVIKNEELLSLRGGYGYPTYRCYYNLGDLGRCTHFLGYINTAGCEIAYELCAELYGGGCVECGDCTSWCE